MPSFDAGQTEADCTFQVQPHTEHGVSLRGGALLGVVFLTAVVVGAAAGFVQRWFYLIVLFPALMAVAIGGVGWWASLRFRVAAPWLNLAGGALAGVLAIVSMHYVTYLQFDRELRGVDEEIRVVAENLPVFQRELEDLPPDVADLVRYLQEDPLLVQAMGVRSFGGFMDWNAAAGVVVSPTASGDPGDLGLHLGYTGTRIYWVLELLVVAGLVALMMYDATTRNPICLACANLKRLSMLIPVQGSEERVVQALEGGDVSRLHPTASASDGREPHHFLCVYECFQCGDDAPIEVAVGDPISITDDPKETRVSRSRTVTYPGQALDAFGRLFAETTDGAVP